MRPVVILMAKAPIAGTVKTRLQERLGPEGVIALHRAFVEDTVAQVAAVAAGAFRFCIACSPDSTHPFFANLVRRYGGGLVDQGPGDLGARMARHQEQHFTAGVPSVTFLGTDSPTLPLVHLNDAWKRLERVPVVLGPAEDGGYYLFASTRPTPEAFRGIDWGTERVLDQTRERLEAAGTPCSLLPAWWDVDRPEDLERLRESLAASPTRARATARVLPQIFGGG